MGRASSTWYDKFGIVAVICDVCSVILGIMLGELLFPKISLFLSAVGVQIVHDILFYLFVIRPLPEGTNALIDLMKLYATQESFTPIIGDSIMMLSSVFMYKFFSTQSTQITSFAGVLGLYGITYIIYTK
jgi:hypothetical protein